ncbi:ATP-binding protein [Streptomyces sp. 6N223]|uniref:ATP-binding protein n=1 Tax=Streptomyces sp. 6N223 TaxID=3457412 RepID=UPI003FD260AA
MTAHPAWWTGEKTADGVLGGRRTAALAPLPPSGRLPFAALARQPSAEPREDRQAPDSGDDPGADAAGFVTFPLANAPESPGAARGLTRTTLHGWGLHELADDASVVVSELVTNALRYGVPPEGQRRPLPPATTEQPFLLSLVHYGGSVLCAVFDPGAEVPVVREPDFLRESGRGLHVLQSLSESWGWTTPDRHGKAVWALLQSGRETESGQEPVAGSPLGPADAEWEPLTRLLLLLELLSGPSWLKALGASARGPLGGGEHAD